MFNRRTTRMAAKDCPHTEMITTETAGLKRSACVSCGHVSVGFGHAMWQTEESEKAAEQYVTQD